VAGKTVEEATDRALDQLGVAVADAEVIVVSEPKTGLFGRMRVEARVRARVRPVGARPRRERARRNNRSGQGGRQGGQRSASGNGSRSGRDGAGSNGAGRSGGSQRGGTDRDGSEQPVGATATRAGGSGGSGSGTSRSARRRRNRRAAASGAGAGAAGAARTGATDDSKDGSAGGPVAERASQRSTEPKETPEMAEGMTLEEQGEVGREFVTGLLGELSMDGTVETRILDEETVEIAAAGDDLGMLVGPRGSTLTALQDLTRAVVQRQCPSRTDRILVDVAGYRERRSAALKRFSVQIAEEVLASGQERALEAMSPADRKSVHDAINEMSGVVTRSEGEDPHRHIVIAPAG